jgi:hypothetical protein
MSNLFSRPLSAAFVALMIAVGSPALADTDTFLFSYEATPSAGFDLPKLPSATYEQRADFSAKMLAGIVPRIAEAVGIDPGGLASEVTPGGYLLKTNASLQTQVDLEDSQAERFAAALGYVFRQYSILVSSLDDGEGKTGYVMVAFPENTLNATVAQTFFEKAASVDKGLGGGYTAFGDNQIFLNVVDGEGKPYSGLDNEAFLAGLTKAAAEFGPPKPKIADSGTATARFIGNEWDKQPKGEAYLDILGGADAETLKALDAIEADYAKLVEAAFR